MNEAIDLAYDLVKEKCSKGGLDSLVANEKVLWLTLTALGFIQVEGLHGYLFWLCDDVPREEVVDAFFDLGIEAPALDIVEAGEVLLTYLGQTTEAELCPDDLRRRHGQELTLIEQRIYRLESKINDSLLPIAQSILENR
jgi:hypothetical protein